VVVAKTLSNKDGLEDVNNILQEVFNMDNNYQEDFEVDILKNQVYHVLVYEGNNEDPPIATGRLVIDGHVARLKWIAVSIKYRRNRYGDMVVRMLVDKAISLHCFDIEADIPPHLKGMFEEIGFLPIKDTPDKKFMSTICNSISVKFNNSHVNSCKKT
jgi:hypothetical protein